MKKMGSRGWSLLELLLVMVVMGIFTTTAAWSTNGYMLTTRLQCAADMIGTDIRKARLSVYHYGDPYVIDFRPNTSSYVVNGRIEIPLPEGISFGAAQNVTGKPSSPSDAPPRDGITFNAEGIANRAKFMPKSLVIPTGAVYLTNGRETLAITVSLTGHTTLWRSKGGNKWVEL